MSTMTALTSASPKTVVLASADLSFRQRVRETLIGLRWEVREAGGGAETLAHLDTSLAEMVVLDSWLPDLEIREFIAEFERLHPGVDLITLDEDLPVRTAARSPRRNEVLFALRRASDYDGAAWNAAPQILRTEKAVTEKVTFPSKPQAVEAVPRSSVASPACRLPELIGDHPSMLEVSRRIRLVAPHTTSVLIQGPTGTGKELIARAVHRLSARSSRPFLALNCAAIPEALLEAELFGHTRGAFTGAVQSRVGRIEAANGGTLFLDEIGEMPVALQSKLLRFLESGELQRVGENEPVKVDVRLVAATHRPLGQLASEGSFRADLYYRLAVFLIRTPSLAMHLDDLSMLASYFLNKMSERSPAKSLDFEAMSRLRNHSWPGNVRELGHVLERAWILAEDRPVITAQEIEFGDDLSLV
jgi:DNA-binding NtrC family response regulator